MCSIRHFKPNFPVDSSELDLACVASVSVEQRAKKKRSFRRFARAKNGARAKIRRRGWERGRKEPSFPSPTPSFLFLLSPHFSRGQNAESPVSSSLFAPWKRLLRRLNSIPFQVVMAVIVLGAPNGKCGDWG